MGQGALRSAALLCTNLFFGGITREWDYQTGFHRFPQEQWRMPSPAATDLMGQFVVRKRNAVKHTLQAGQGVEPYSHFLITEECGSLCLLESVKLTGGQ